MDSPGNGWFPVARTVLWAALAACFLGLLLRSMDSSNITSMVHLPASVTINAAASSTGGSTLGQMEAAAAEAAPSTPLAHLDPELTHFDLDALEASGDDEDDEIPWAALALATASTPAGSTSSTRGSAGGSQGPPDGAAAAAGTAAPVAASPQAPMVTRTSDGNCTATPEFISYQPSAWEQEWLNNAAKFQAQPELVCQILLAESDKVGTWLEVTSKRQRGTLGRDLDHAIFSRFKYRDPCTGKEFFAYIEPVVGHFRHPRMPPACQPPGKPVGGIQDRSYVLLQGGQQQYSRSGKGYLFDLGTATFPSSVGWMIEYYSDLGVQFNEIWAWEIKNLEPNEYWGAVPPEVQPKLHFYNIPVSVEPQDPSNPLNTLKEIHRPGDYTVIKLDIDNSKLELALIDQIESDPKLPSMISDIVFEMHYDHPDMAMYFGWNNKKTWLDVVTKFHDLRSKGLRVHYWP